MMKVMKMRTVTLLVTLLCVGLCVPVENKRKQRDLSAEDLVALPVQDQMMIPEELISPYCLYYGYCRYPYYPNYPYYSPYYPSYSSQRYYPQQRPASYPDLNSQLPIQPPIIILEQPSTNQTG